MLSLLVLRVCISLNGIMQWPLEFKPTSRQFAFDTIERWHSLETKTAALCTSGTIHLLVDITFHGSGAVLSSLPPTLSEPLRNSDPSRATTISSRSLPTNISDTLLEITEIQWQSTCRDSSNYVWTHLHHSLARRTGKSFTNASELM